MLAQTGMTPMHTAHKANSIPKDQVTFPSISDTQSISVEQPVQAQWLGLCLKTYILSQAILNNDHSALLQQTHNNPMISCILQAVNALWHVVYLQRVHTVEPCQTMSGQWTCLC